MTTWNARQWRGCSLLFPLMLLACSDGRAAPTSFNEPPLLTLTSSSEEIVGGGGAKLTVYETGRAHGPSIVFIHGFTGNQLSWERQLSGRLAQRYRLIAFDLRGHGASDKPLEAENYTDSRLWAEDLAAVIRAKNLHRPVLVGWSYGGYVISDYVRAFGDGALGGLVFVGAVTKNGTPEATGFFTDEALPVFGGLFSPELRTRIDATRALTRMFADPPGSDVWETAFGSAMMVPLEVRIGMFSRVLDNDDVLTGIRVPTLVIHGGGDRVVRVSAGEHIAATVHGARLLVYDGVGHAPHLEDPERFNRDLAEFVRSARRNRGH